MSCCLEVLMDGLVGLLAVQTQRLLLCPQLPPPPLKYPFSLLFLSQTIYFHTSLNHPGIAAVVEVVATAGKGDGGSRHLSCGFGLIPLFGSGSEATDPAAEDRA